MQKVSMLILIGQEHAWTAASCDHFLPDLTGCAVAVRGGAATLSLSLGFLGFFLLMGSAM